MEQSIREEVHITEKSPKKSIYPKSIKAELGVLRHHCKITWDESAVLPKYPLCQTSAPPEKEVERTRAATFRDLRSWPKIRKYRRNGVTSQSCRRRQLRLANWAWKYYLDVSWVKILIRVWQRYFYVQKLSLITTVFISLDPRKCSCLCEILVRCVHAVRKSRMAPTLKTWNDHRPWPPHPKISAIQGRQV